MAGVEFSANGLLWPAVVSGVLLLANVAWSIWKKKPPRGEPLPPKVVAGMLQGKPESWAEFNRLLKQPPPPAEPDPLEQIRAIVQGAKPKT